MVRALHIHEVHGKLKIFGHSATEASGEKSGVVDSHSSRVSDSTLAVALSSTPAEPLHTRRATRSQDPASSSVASIFDSLNAPWGRLVSSLCPAYSAGSRHSALDYPVSPFVASVPRISRDSDQPCREGR